MQQKQYALPEFNLIVFLDGLSEEMRGKIAATKHENGQLIVHFLTPLSWDEEQTLGAYVAAHDVDAPLSSTAQHEKDLDRYTRRASVKDLIIAEMAAENMERVRSGVWTVADLVALTQDPILKEIILDILILSFELAYQKIDAITNDLITTEIKNHWKAKLASHFYL